MVEQAEVQKDKVSKMLRKTEKEARQYHVPARPERILQNAGRRGGTKRKGKCQKWKGLSIFGEVFGKQKKERQIFHGWKR